MVEKLTRDQQRAQAREKAKKMHAESVKKQKRKKLFIQLGIISSVLAVAGIIVVSLASVKPPTPQVNPENMLSDGIVLNQDLSVLETPAIEVGGEPTPTVSDSSKVKVDVYVDYLCPFCKQFESSQEAVLKKWVESGDVQLEVHPLALVSQYSAIAANASACVASMEPTRWWEMNYVLYADQPDEVAAKNWAKQTSIKHVKQVGESIGLNQDTVKCIEDVPYFDWSVASTERATSGPLPHEGIKVIEGTPTVVIDGQQWREDFISNPNVLDEFLQNAVNAKKK